MSTKFILKVTFSLIILLAFINLVSAATCWDYGGNQAGCLNSSDSLECSFQSAGSGWCPASATGGCCDKVSCWKYDGNRVACQAATSLGCTWESNVYNQENWCTVKPSNPFSNNGTQVYGDNIGCCSDPGCWDADGTNATYCNGTETDFMGGVCNLVTDDPYCDDPTGNCCVMKQCSSLNNQTRCEKAISLGSPCKWTGAACVNQGFGGLNGSDACVGGGGVWNGSTCAMPTFNKEVHCWFADNKPEVCRNITGCVYCTNLSTIIGNQSGGGNISNVSSMCYQKTVGWCQGHENPWYNTGNLTTDCATDPIECIDIKIKNACDCGPLPGCYWNNTNASIVNGTFCAPGVSQCNIKIEDMTFKKCSDAPNQSECNTLINTYFMPCIFNQSGKSKCEFDWQSGGGFGDAKGSTDIDFFDISNENSCTMAGGNWKSVVIDAYGNKDEWCEFGFGQGLMKCNDTCWACEFQGNGTTWTTSALAQTACEDSPAVGSACEFTSFGGSQDSTGRWGWCDFPEAMNFFGGGTCETSCYDCFNSQMCNSSQANCTWSQDSMNIGPGWCDPKAVAIYMNCSTNPPACMGQSACQNAGFNWTSNYVSDPFNNQPMWVCIRNGTTPELCFDGADNDNDTMIDCVDTNCSLDPKCGYGMGTSVGPGGAGGGMMLPPELEEILCYDYDDTNRSACEAIIVDSIVFNNTNYNGTHRGNSSYSKLPRHLNRTVVCYYHPAPPDAPETSWCDPVYTQQMTGKMDMGKPPEPLGFDSEGDANNMKYVDIKLIGIKDDPQTMDIGIPVKNITNLSICNTALGGRANATFFRYLDVDNSESTGCTATNGTYDGFDYKMAVSGTWNGSEAIIKTAAFKCVNSTSNVWTPKSASLNVVKEGCFASPFDQDFKGVNVLVFTKNDFGIATSNMRVYAATAAQGYNETNITDEAGPFYYTPGSIDFKNEDCFGFADVDGDGYKPEQDPDCKFIKSLGFVPFENCGNSIDDDGDGLTDCNDPTCSFTPKCAGGSFNFAANATDKTAPTISSYSVQEFNDGAFIQFDTYEIANGTVLFYYNSSGCSILNKTMHDLGSPEWIYDDFKPFHAVPVDNFEGNSNKIGYNLVNNTNYFYKYRVCDPSGNCATSACLNFTTKRVMQNFTFSTTVPSGFNVFNPWGTGNLSLYGITLNTSAAKKKNITVSCPASGYAITFNEVYVKSAAALDFSDMVCNDATEVIGMESNTWNTLMTKLAPQSIQITWNTPGTGATIYYCTDANGTTCNRDVTTYLNCTTTTTNISCKVPTTLGFSSYKLSAAASSTTSTATTGGGGSSSIASPAKESVTASQMWGSVAAGETVTMNIDNPKIDVTSVAVYVRNELASVSIDVSSLKEKPESLSAPEKTVYKYLQITPTNMQNKDINSATISFKVEKSWLTQNSIAENDIVLMRYTDKWSELETTSLKSDSSYAYYQAKTPGFSYFVISSKSAAKELPASEEKKTEVTPETETLPEGEKEALVTPADMTWIIWLIAAIVVIVIIYLVAKKKK